MFSLADLLARRKDFALLWAGQSLSLFGSSLLIVAVPYWLFDLTGSILILGAYSITLLVTQLALAPLTGLLVDRFDRRAVILWSNLFRGAVTLIPLLVGSAADVWLIFLAGALVTAGRRLFDPAWQARTPDPLRGRAFSFRDALIASGSLIATAGGSAAGEYAGVRAVFFAAAGLIAATTLVAAAVLPRGAQEGETPAWK